MSGYQETKPNLTYGWYPFCREKIGKGNYLSENQKDMAVKGYKLDTYGVKPVETLPTKSNCGYYRTMAFGYSWENIETSA